MSEPSWSVGPPRTIVLATDLSSRCDRATERASALAKGWNARLIILNVIEPVEHYARGRDGLDLPSWRRPAEAEAVALTRIQREFGKTLGEFEVRVVAGEPVAMIEEVAQDVGAELIVVGTARDETLGRCFLGSTVDRLARQTPIPLLIVKSRVRPYDEVLVATDFSEPSQHALVAADRFFGDARLTLLHGWEVPFAGFLDQGDFREQWRAHEQKGCEDFLQRSNLSAETRNRLQVLVENGCPEALVRSYMLDKNVDLVVVGTHGRSGMFDRRLGGTAKRILEFAPGDVLLIREPRAVHPARRSS